MNALPKQLNSQKSTIEPLGKQVFTSNALLRTDFFRTSRVKQKDINQLELQIFNEPDYSAPTKLIIDDERGSLHLTRQANQIRIDKGLFLAPNANAINQDWVTRQDYERDLFEDHKGRLISYLGRQRLKPVVVNVLNNLLANLINASNQRAQLLYSRTTKGSNKLLLDVVNYLASDGLILNIIGKDNEYQDNASWMIPSDKLKLEIAQSQIKIGLIKGYNPIVLRDDDKQPMKISKDRNIQVKAKRLSLPVNQYNSLWLEHTATTSVGEIVPFAKRIFNRTLDLGGRFYSPIQNITRAQRNTVFIDNEETCEPDFKAIHFCLLYAEEGIQLNPRINDPYKLRGFTRPIVKLAMLTFLNSSDLGVFARNITRSGDPKVKAGAARQKQLMETHLLRVTQGLPSKQPKGKDYLKGFTDGMPDNINGNELLEALKEKHSAVAHLFGGDDIGLKLQNIDSQIMSAILGSASALDIPLLPVHDSVICKKSDLDTVVDLMEKSFLSVTKYHGFVDTK